VVTEEALANITLPQLDQRFAALRIVNPAAEAAVLQSMQKYGQLSPVVANRGDGPGRYELLDGFKRFRAAQKLGFERLQTRLVALGARASKAAILQLNWVGPSVHHLRKRWCWSRWCARMG
jgi:ParB-like chromosome segregation protein Spo0J